MFTESEVITFINENDVKFIKLAFCDIFGMQKNLSILASELNRAFETGIAFDASLVAGFSDATQSDLYLVPDPSTLALLPWRPTHGRVVRFFCHIRNKDGTPFALDARALLQKTVAKAKEKGLACNVGAACEFYLFQTDERGEKTETPSDHAGYLDIAPLDRGENVRREICLSLEEMGLLPESSHHEDGPGQHEIDFRHSDPLTSADHVVTFRAVVETIAARNGLYATFHPKPMEMHSGNGFHIKLYPRQLGKIEPDRAYAEHFLAGILRRVPEMTAFLNPIHASYRRLGVYKAPKYVTWSEGNYGQLARLSEERDGAVCIKLRSPDSASNPYLAYTLLLHAGLEGVSDAIPLDAPVDFALETVPSETLQSYVSLAQEFETAMAAARDSAFINAILSPYILDA